MALLRSCVQKYLNLRKRGSVAAVRKPGATARTSVPAARGGSAGGDGTTDQNGDPAPLSTLGAVSH